MMGESNDSLIISLYVWLKVWTGVTRAHRPGTLMMYTAICYIFLGAVVPPLLGAGGRGQVVVLAGSSSSYPRPLSATTISDVLVCALLDYSTASRYYS